MVSFSSLDGQALLICVSFQLNPPLFDICTINRYDRNANGNRDSGISMPDNGSDVEFNLGLGGVKVTLLECNVDTNR
jgi:hypothetical protein